MFPSIDFVEPPFLIPEEDLSPYQVISKHPITEKFDLACVLIKSFIYDLSLLETKDVTQFIQVAFEPEFMDLVTKLGISYIYINKNLFRIFRLFSKFVPKIENIASDYYCAGHIGPVSVQVCEKYLFEDDWILFSTGVTYYKTIIKGLEIK